MPEYHQFARVEFSRFKAFREFRFDLKHFNILVGPNNSGKSTILAAFRILAAAMRKAGSRRATSVYTWRGSTLGHAVDLTTISVAEENIFYNYDESEPASVDFRLSNGNTLTLYFPERGVCYLLPDAQGRNIESPTSFAREFNCPIGFVPILGPVEHHEPLYEREAARLALFNYRAARNFRNIWYHFPERFEEFRATLVETWPGMDVGRPQVDTSYGKPRLNMFCPEKRIPRELFWAGFGFQVWCQMLTHIIQSRDVSVFLIDEPDIYLHSDLQRQLIGILRDLGPDILVATHSTEIVSEAETDDILIIDKSRSTARRIRNPSELEGLFEMLGSNINPILTQLAKTRRVIFVEGKDFQVLGRFAQKLGLTSVANRQNFAVVPIEGFNPDRIRSLKAGMEATLGGRVLAGAILDRDYRSNEERLQIEGQCTDFCDFVAIHGRKELENFLLVPDALDRALRARIADRERRSGAKIEFTPLADEVLRHFAEAKKNYVAGQFLAERRRFERTNSPKLHESAVAQRALEEFDQGWGSREGQLACLPGKDALTAFNKIAQQRFGVSVTPSGVVSSMWQSEIPAEMQELIAALDLFGKSPVFAAPA